MPRVSAGTQAGRSGGRHRGKQGTEAAGARRQDGHVAGRHVGEVGLQGRGERGAPVIAKGRHALAQDAQHRLPPRPVLSMACGGCYRGARQPLLPTSQGSTTEAPQDAVLPSAAPREPWTVRARARMQGARSAAPCWLGAWGARLQHGDGRRGRRHLQRHGHAQVADLPQAALRHARVVQLLAQREARARRRPAAQLVVPGPQPRGLERAQLRPAGRHGALRRSRRGNASALPLAPSCHTPPG